MAEKLVKYYKHISDTMGIPGRMALAKLTKMPFIVAATTPDTPEKIERFKAAIKKLTGKPAPNL